MIENYKQAIDYFNSLILNEFPVDLKCWIAGGAVRDYFSVSYISSDIDIFFSNRPDFHDVYNFFIKVKAKKVFENDRVVRFEYKKNSFDLVKIHFNSPQETINEFDFTVCCAAIDTEQVYHHEAFFMDLAKKRLVINNLPFPLSTLQRLQKYIKKGYWICNGGLLDIARAIQVVDLNEPSNNTLEFYPDGQPRFLRFD